MNKREIASNYNSSITKRDYKRSRVRSNAERVEREKVESTLVYWLR
ncbi:MAG: hypothetical protein ABJ387_13485 [Balneola sp.]